MTQASSNPGHVIQPRTWGEFWQACGYGALACWAVVFYFYPPTAFANALDEATRTWWLLAVLVGAIAAIVGLVTRLDIKVEMPGVIVCLVGPFAYAASQAYYVFYPEAQGYAITSGTSPVNRYALIIYALLPGILLLPRIWVLRRQAMQAKSARKTKAATEKALAEARSTLAGMAGQPEPCPDKPCPPPPLLPEPTDIFTSGSLRLRPAKDILRDAENTLRSQKP